MLAGGQDEGRIRPRRLPVANAVVGTLFVRPRDIYEFNAIRTCLAYALRQPLDAFDRSSP